jgi:ABC-type dipeptide/oligopeptide/nickel transport system ATPase subunit
LIAALVQRLIAGTPKSIHKIASFDEAWFMLDSQDGRRVIDRINHMGRSMNATLLLISQELTEVAAIEGLIGTRVSFGQETHGGAEAALRSCTALDPENRRMRDRVRAYRKGRCLMTDIDGQHRGTPSRPCATRTC